MFHWICPECGREIAPTVRECPVCDPGAAAAEPALVGVVEAPARALNAEAPARANAEVHARVGNSDMPTSRGVNGEPPARAAEVIERVPAEVPPLTRESQPPVLRLDEPPVRIPAVEVIPPQRTPKSAPVPPPLPVMPDAVIPEVVTPHVAPPDAPGMAAKVEAPSIPEPPVTPPPPPPLSEPQIARLIVGKAVPVLPQRPAGSAVAGEVAPTAVSPEAGLRSLQKLVARIGVRPADEPAPIEKPKEPEFRAPAREEVPVPVNVSVQAPPTVPPPGADLEPLLRAPGSRLARPRPTQSKPEASPKPVRIPVPLNLPAAKPAVAASAVQPAEALVLEGSPARKPEARIASAAPRSAEYVRYSPLANRPLRPVAPNRRVARTDCVPRITLPGPMLSTRLAHFRDPELVPSFTAKHRVMKLGSNGWLVTALVTLLLVAVGIAGISYLMPHPAAEVKPPAKTVAKAEPEKQAAVPESNVVSEPPPVSSGSSPLARSVEVTGFRIVMNPTKKSEIQYLVVNHSPSRFTGVTVFVTLRSANAKPGQPPLCRFSFAAPNLGPFEAKEMTSSIEKMNRPISLPEWQDLRAELEVAE